MSSTTYNKKHTGIYFIGLLSIAFFYYHPSFIDILILKDPNAIAMARNLGMGKYYEVATLSILISLVIYGGILSLPKKFAKEPISHTPLQALGGLIFVFGGITQPNKTYLVFLALILITVFSPYWRTSNKNLHSSLLIIIISVSATLAIAIYELATNTAWAIYTSSSGEVIRRPSAFFYNPNVFGFWMALIAAALSAAYFNTDRKSLCVIGVILCGIGAILASSRGFSYLLLVSVISIAVAHHRQWRSGIHLIIILLSTMLGGSYLLVLANTILSTQLTDTMAGLAWRILNAPIELITHAFSTITGHATSIPGHVTEEFKSSFSGRFSGNAPDSGIKNLLTELNPFSLTGLLLFYSGCLLRAKALGRERLKLFSLMTMFFVLSGVFMSYTVLPVWLSWAALLAIVLHVEPKQKQSHTKATLEINSRSTYPSTPTS